MEIEYEKTYLAKYLPNDLNKYPFKEYLDVYFPQKADHPVIRIRKRGNDYEITKKYPVTGIDSSIQQEITISLTKDEFEELESGITGKRVHKNRYFYQTTQYLAEIDVFQGDLLELVLIDIEFPNKQTMDEFVAPDFCLAEITQDKTFAGGKLAGAKYSDLQQELDKFGYKPIMGIND